MRCFTFSFSSPDTILIPGIAVNTNEITLGKRGRHCWEERIAICRRDPAPVSQDGFMHDAELKLIFPRHGGKEFLVAARSSYSWWNTYLVLIKQVHQAEKMRNSTIIIAGHYEDFSQDLIVELRVNGVIKLTFANDVEQYLVHNGAEPECFSHKSFLAYEEERQQKLVTIRQGYVDRALQQDTARNEGVDREEAETQAHNAIKEAQVASLEKRSVLNVSAIETVPDASVHYAEVNWQGWSLSPDEQVPADAQLVSLSNGERFLILSRTLLLTRQTLSGYDDRHTYEQTWEIRSFAWQATMWVPTRYLKTRQKFWWPDGTEYRVYLPDILQVGQELPAYCYPFRGMSLRIGRQPWECVSTGAFSIPCQRPNGLGEWNAWKALWPSWAHKLVRLSEKSWHRLIRAIEGQFLTDVFNADEWAKAGFNPAATVAKLHREHAGARRSANTGCFHGHEGTYLAFSTGSGLRLMWTLSGEQGKVYVVDSPDVSACYIFTKEQDARDWASGRVTWQEAKLNARRVIHQGSWGARISTILTELGVNPPAQAC